MISVTQQTERIQRAASQMSGWSFEDASSVYGEPATRVTTSGGRYLVFSDSCTCKDDTERLRGTGALCKHRTAVAFVNAPQPTDPFAGDAGAMTPAEWTAMRNSQQAADLATRRAQAIRDQAMWE